MDSKQQSEFIKKYELLCQGLGIDFYCYSFYFSEYKENMARFVEILEQEKHSLYLTYLTFFDNNGNLFSTNLGGVVDNLIKPKKFLVNSILAQKDIKQKAKELMIKEIVFSSPENPFQWGLNHERQASKLADKIIEGLAATFTTNNAYRIQDFFLKNDPYFKYLAEAKRYDYCIDYVQSKVPEANLDKFLNFLDTFEKQVIEQIKEEYLSTKNSQQAVSEGAMVIGGVGEVKRKEGMQRQDFVNKQEFDEILENAFDGIVGLDSIRKELEKIVAMNMYAQSSKPINILLTGNPGTGKSTVAEIISEVLYMCGVTYTDKFTKITAADLQGQYVGQTIPKIQKVFSDNRGGVIFLDEIYSLATDTAFSKDAVNELLLQLESEKNSGTVIIAAGYEDKINDFFRANSGLKSRFSKTINLKDYTLDELMQIATNNIEEAEIIIQEDAMERFREQVSSAMKSPNFGNARYVKNAVEEISENAVLRAWQGEDIQPEIEIQDVEKYIADSEKSKISERKIGFN